MFAAEVFQSRCRLFACKIWTVWAVFVTLKTLLTIRHPQKNCIMIIYWASQNYNLFLSDSSLHLITCLARPEHQIELIGVDLTSATFEVQISGYFDNFILCDEIYISGASNTVSLYPSDSPQKPGKVYAVGLQPDTCYTLSTVCCDLYRNNPYTKTGRDCSGGDDYKYFCTGILISSVV